MEAIVKQKTAELEHSIAYVFCETCGTIFYKGLAFGILDKSDFIWDFRYLAFRHAWDNPDHVVLVCLPYLEKTEQNVELALRLGEVILGDQCCMQIRNGKIVFNFSLLVDRLRRRLIELNDPRAVRKSDENWDPNVDRIMCSNCKRVYNNVKDACYCCLDSKPWLPISELEA